MKKKELLKLIKDLQDENDIDEVIATSELAIKFGGLDVFKEKINKDKDFKRFIDSEKDKYNAKALETWKANNLQKLIDDKVKELYPDEDPKDSELKKLKLEMETMKKETLKKELTNKALKKMTYYGFPTDLVDFLVGADEDSTVKNIDLFKEKFTSKLETTVKERLKDNS